VSRNFWYTVLYMTTSTSTTTGSASFHSARDMVARGGVALLTGAGISTASGIPDYRGSRGTWRVDPGAEVSAHIDQWRGERDLRVSSWADLVARRGRVHTPNAAHYALAEFEKTGRLEGLLTQNIDGLHLRAGTSPPLLLELHGSTRSVRCLTCRAITETDEICDRVEAGEEDPACRVAGSSGDVCGGILKLDIVSFGEDLSRSVMVRARQAVVRASTLVVIGTTLNVYPAAWHVDLAMERHIRVVIINDSPTEYDRGATVLRGDISDLVPALFSGLT
jgi:NAD-dependent deacetylase